MSEVRFWIGVVSREHVQRGVEAGIAQLNHGKRAPLARMKRGDWLIYYSPRTNYPAGETLQAFTALGQITSDEPYQVRLSEDFQPFRHNVRYIEGREASIRKVLADLEFLPDKEHWGARFRYGHFAVSRTDFQRIAQAMDVKLEGVG